MLTFESASVLGINNIIEKLSVRIPNSSPPDVACS